MYVTGRSVHTMQFVKFRRGRIIVPPTSPAVSEKLNHSATTSKAKTRNYRYNMQIGNVPHKVQYYILSYIISYYIL